MTAHIICRTGCILFLHLLWFLVTVADCGWAVSDTLSRTLGSPVRSTLPIIYHQHHHCHRRRHLRHRDRWWWLFTIHTSSITYHSQLYSTPSNTCCIFAFTPLNIFPKRNMFSLLTKYIFPPILSIKKFSWMWVLEKVTVFHFLYIFSKIRQIYPSGRKWRVPTMCCEATLNRRNFRKHTITDAKCGRLQKCHKSALQSP